MLLENWKTYSDINLDALNRCTVFSSSVERSGGLLRVNLRCGAETSTTEGIAVPKKQTVDYEQNFRLGNQLLSSRQTLLIKKRNRISAQRSVRSTLKRIFIRE